MKKKYSVFRDYIERSEGQFAVWLAVMAFPLLVLTSGVLDYRHVESQQGNIKNALDTATLSAVSDSVTPLAQKPDLAKSVFWDNYGGDVDLNLDVKATDGRVEMTAKGAVPASVGRAVGLSDFNISEKSVAEMTRQNTICVLSLAEDGEGRVKFLGKTEFNSPTCAVQSNSSHSNGLISDSEIAPVAKTFCSSGGVSGEFSPQARGECAVIEDPYKNLDTPEGGVCLPSEAFNSVPVNPTTTTSARNPNNRSHRHRHCHGRNACHAHDHLYGVNHHSSPNIINRVSESGVSGHELRRLLAQYDPRHLSVPESTNYTGNNRILFPGSYCGGLTVDGVNVIFMPGIYEITDGPLTFKNGAVANAENVAFVFKGSDAVLTVESGSQVSVKAPSTGAMAGMAFFQSVEPDMKNSKNVQLPSGVNILSSGGALNVTGTLYFPTQALEILGDSELGARSPATSFIAYEVTFAGETRASVEVDHVEADIPPMMPFSDDGARLVE
jgi:Flp pilus assembly protein TadG